MYSKLCKNQITLDHTHRFSTLFAFIAILHLKVSAFFFPLHSAYGNAGILWWHYNDLAIFLRYFNVFFPAKFSFWGDVRAPCLVFLR